MIRLLAGHNPTLPVYYDLENESTVGSLSNAQILHQVDLFCTKVSGAGYKTGVYANPTWWNGHLAGNTYSGNTKWLAAWDNGTYASQAGSYAIWQFTSNGAVPGVNDRVDLNYSVNYNFGTISPVVEPVSAPDFVLPTSLTIVEDEAFYGCSFVYAKLPETATKIGNKAFAYCSNLRHIYIPEATTTIAANAFEGVTNLTIHGVDGSYAEFYASKPCRGMTIFSGRIFCAECGASFGPKVWHSNDQYRRVIWQCNNKYKGTKVCRMPHLYEDGLQAEFLKLCNKVVSNREREIADMQELLVVIGGTEELETKKAGLEAERDALAVQLQELIDQNAKVAQNQETYILQYDQLASQYMAADEQVKELGQVILEKEMRIRQIADYITTLETMPSTVTEFQPELWASLVERVTVHGKNDVSFTMTSGAEVRA